MRQQAGDTNKKEGDAFLAENKTKDGVITLPSGLQYKVVKAVTDQSCRYGFGRMQLPAR